MIGRCTWCHRVDEISGDHVFPRAMGGTKALKVPACRACQTAISKAEDEATHRSWFAILRLKYGPGPRHRRRPTSGAVRARLMLARVEDGYAEVVVRVGGQHIMLPSIELRADGSTYGRGVSPRDIDRVAAALRDVCRPGGKISPALLDRDAEANIRDDPMFSPRVYLDLDGRLWLRARNGDEAARTATILARMAVAGAFDGPHTTGWQTGVVGPGTTHHFSLDYDITPVLRVAAKIAYGLVALTLPTSIIEADPYAEVREYVRAGAETEGHAPPQEVNDVDGLSHQPEYHLACLDFDAGRLRGIVALYGAVYLVDLGLLAEPPAALPVAVSRRDGRETRFVAGEEAEEVRRLLQAHVASRPAYGSPTPA